MKFFTIDDENDIRVHASAQEADAIANAERFNTPAALAKLADKWPVARLVEIWNSLPGASPVKKFTDRKTAAARIWKAIQSLGAPAAAQQPEAMGQTPVTEPAAGPQQPESAPENAEPLVGSEAVVVATELQPNPDVIIEAQEPSEAPVEVPQQNAPFDQPVPDVSAQGAGVATTEPTPTKRATRGKKTPTDTQNAKGPRENSKTSRLIEMLKRKGGTTLEEIMADMGWLKHTTRAMLSAGGALAKKHGLVVTSEKVGDKRTYSIKA